MLCERYRTKPATERKLLVEENNLCFNCLGRHKVSDCSSKKTCSVCGSRHHSSLHDAYRESEGGKSSLVVRHKREEPASVLLATARVRVSDRLGKLHNVRALVDQGSEASIISERLAQRLKLPRSSTNSIAVYGVGGVKTAVAKGRVTLKISPRFSGPSISVSAIILPKLTVYMGGVSSEKSSWPHLQDLKLVDPGFCDSDAVDILLGAEVYGGILLSGLRKGETCQPVAQHTTLGWLVSGTVDHSSERQLRSHECHLEDDLSTIVRRFWEQEEFPSAVTTLTKEEQECEEFYARTHSRQPDGRYVVRLPIVSPLPDLSGTRCLALRMLRRMESRFKREEIFRIRYLEFLQQYNELGHMTEVASADATAGRSCCYLPHHGVLREASTSTKLRVVFNGSAVLSSGNSLNQLFQAGLNLLPSLPDLLLQWRRHRFVVITDVEKMYRQIVVHPEDRNLQRILWRDNSLQEVKEFQLNTITYGLACAPFLAIRTLRQLADDEEKNFPLGAAALRQEVYMDDILSGASSLSAAKEIVRQLMQIGMAGGFPFKKWSANDVSLLEGVPIEDRLQQEPRWWRTGESHSTLGLRWHPLEDCFSFSAKQPPLETITKPSVLSLSAKIFDPLGWLSPTTIRTKILIQTTWLLGLDWDAPLPERDASLWRAYQSELHLLEEIRVRRWMNGEISHSQYEFHGFADASEKAYAAVIYLRTENQQGAVEISLVIAKTRVAPLKQVSLPRLELCAAVLLSRLVAHTKRILGLEKAPAHLWTDSMVTLGWIRGHPSSWKTYIANRVSEIQTVLPDAFWHHVDGRDNPADCASRGVSPRELIHHPLWWLGPPWLSSESIRGLTSNEEIFDELPERRVQHILSAVTNQADTKSDILPRFSSLNRLLRVTAWCLRWKRQGRCDERNESLILQSEELAQASLRWILQVQKSEFNSELDSLKRNLSFPVRSPLLKLCPFLDGQGVLRVGGRLKHSILSYEEKHPVILPSDSHFTRLVIEAEHRRTLHGGVQLTLSAIRQRFWIPRGKALVKRSIHRCHQCLRWRAAVPQPLMSDLPTPRVTPTRPFLNTGVDYAGPFWLRTTKGRGHRATKAFLAVFVCLSTRAVHLDIVSDHSAEAFIAALRRFVSRRGLCRSIYSDCGTNFIGADSQLRALFSASNPEGQRIASFAANEQIKWR